MALLMPMTLPCMSNSGPPELPRLMAASVWMKRSNAPPCPVERETADTMPLVTVPPRPKGLPMAITQSPTRAWALSPKLTKGNGSARWIFSTARSDAGIGADDFCLILGAVGKGDRHFFQLGALASGETT